MDYSHPLEGTISTFVWEQTPLLPRIYVHVVANEVTESLEFMAETQEPLDQAQITQIRDILKQPRDSPPPNDAEFGLFRYDVERHGFVNALKLHGFTQAQEEDQFCEGIDRKQENLEQDESIGHDESSPPAHNRQLTS